MNNTTDFKRVEVELLQWVKS